MYIFVRFGYVWIRLACSIEIWPEVFLWHQCICAAQLLAAGAKPRREDSAEGFGVHPEGAAVTGKHVFLLDVLFPFIFTENHS